MEADEFDELIRSLRPAFWDQAACLGAGVEHFFPVIGGTNSVGLTMIAIERWCSRCEVVDQCHDYAIEQASQFTERCRYGIWAGQGQSAILRPVKQAKNVRERDARGGQPRPERRWPKHKRGNRPKVAPPPPAPVPVPVQIRPTYDQRRKTSWLRQHRLDHRGESRTCTACGASFSAYEHSASFVQCGDCRKQYERDHAYRLAQRGKRGLCHRCGAQFIKYVHSATGTSCGECIRRDAREYSARKRKNAGHDNVMT